MSTEERRRHRRQSAKVPLYVRIADRVVQKWVEMEARNISEGGLCFETRQDVPVDSEVQVMVGRLGEGLPASAHISARVIHTEASPETGRRRVGIEFVEMVDVTWQQLLERLPAVETPEGASGSGELQG